MSVAKLKSIEDGVHKQLVRLKAAAAQDATLAPLYDQLLGAWGAMYSEVRRQQLEEASRDGGDQEIVTIFAPRPNGGMTETRLCRRILRRRYTSGSEAPWFVELADASTPEKLSFQMRMAS